MATLLTNQTTDTATTGTGASHTDPCTVYASGTFDGCVVTIQVSHEAVAGSFVSPDSETHDDVATLRGPGAIAINARGTYYVRALLAEAGSSTSVSVSTTQ